LFPCEGGEGGDFEHHIAQASAMSVQRIAIVSAAAALISIRLTDGEMMILCQEFTKWPLYLMECGTWAKYVPGHIYFPLSCVLRATCSFTSLMELMELDKNTL